MSRPSGTLSREERYLRTTFLGALAHAIRSPLSIASGALDELSTSGGEHAEMLVGMARRSLGRLDTLAEALGRAADVESGALAVSVGSCDVGAVVRRAVADMPARPRDAVQVVLELERPALSADADPELLALALVQAIDNGLRFARSRLTIRAGVEEERVWIELEDDGPGIEPERRELIFDRYRSARERGADSDLAFGLSLVRDYIRLQGGEVTLAPARGGTGTCCRLELRAARGD